MVEESIRINPCPVAEGRHNTCDGLWITRRNYYSTANLSFGPRDEVRPDAKMPSGDGVQFLVGKTARNDGDRNPKIA